MNLSIKSQTLGLLALITLCFSTSSCDNGPEKERDYTSRTIELTASEMSASTRTNKFTWDLFDKCYAGSSENVVFSPLSANLCLSMLANATEGQSREQILKALDFGDMNMADVNSFNRKLTSDICGIDGKVKLSIANSFWHKSFINPKQDFINEILENYHMQSFIIKDGSFAKDVNAWCKKTTKGLIPQILDDNADKDFALVNAIYFKGSWQYSYNFEKKETKKGEFTNADGSQSQVYFMHKKAGYRYHCAEKWRAMFIPFGGGGFRFTVVLPDDGVSIEECMASVREFDPATAEYESRPLDLKLPKFKINKELDLIEAMKNMGISDIFDYRVSDFSAMTDIKELEVNLIKQRVSFEVDEEGAEAAAVTIAGGDCMAVGPMVNGYELFHVNHPFIFMISEKSTGAILFAGCIKKF